jgi:hypothetical protein
MRRILLSGENVLPVWRGKYVSRYQLLPFCSPLVCTHPHCTLWMPHCYSSPMSSMHLPKGGHHFLGRPLMNLQQFSEFESCICASFPNICFWLYWCFSLLGVRHSPSECWFLIKQCPFEQCTLSFWLGMIPSGLWAGSSWRIHPSRLHKSLILLLFVIVVWCQS